MISGLLSARPVGIDGDKYFATDTELYYLKASGAWTSLTASTTPALTDADIRSVSLTKEIQSLSPTALIELFVLDMTTANGGLMYFHAGTNELTANIVWQGNSYVPFPIETEGFALGTVSTLPRPKVRLSNINGIFSASIAQFNDLIGFKLIRKRTFLKYLDAVNFPTGVNATANPSQCYPDDIWYIDQKISENRYVVEWELASAFDLIGVMLPSRQINQNSCPWAYTGAECGYNQNAANAAHLDSMDNASTLAKDVCGKRLTSCEKRFDPNSKGNVLPFGGFPGAISF